MLKTKELKTQICVQKSHHTNGLIQEFQERFDPIASYLLSCSPSPAWLEDHEFMRNIKAFEKLVLSRDFDMIADEIMASSCYKNIAKKLRQVYEFYEIFLETREVLEMIEHNKLGVNGAHLMRDFKTAKMEGSAAGFDSASKVVFVGSGPFPSTAISYAKTFETQIVCIDYNLEAVFLSKRLLEREGLQDKISVVYSDGANFDYNGFTHVIISALTHRKNKVLRRILNTTRNGTKVVVRTADGLSTLFYEPVDQDSLKKFNIKDTVVDKENIFKSLVLTLKN